MSCGRVTKSQHVCAERDTTAEHFCRCRHPSSRASACAGTHPSPGHACLRCPLACSPRLHRHQIPRGACAGGRLPGCQVLCRHHGGQAWWAARTHEDSPLLQSSTCLGIWISDRGTHRGVVHLALEQTPKNRSYDRGACMHSPIIPCTPAFPCPSMTHTRMLLAENEAGDRQVQLARDIHQAQH